MKTRAVRLQLPLFLLLPTLLLAREYACKLDLPLANSPYGQFPVDPVACVRDTLVRQYMGAPANRLFSYGNTACLACVQCGCDEGFVSSRDALYNYYGWAKDARGIHIDMANAAIARAGNVSNTHGFGPVIAKRSDTVSVCWITFADTLGKARDTRKRRLNCLTRIDGVDSFSLRLIDPDTMPAIGSGTEPRCTELHPETTGRAYDATGRPTRPEAIAVEPRFRREE